MLVQQEIGVETLKSMRKEDLIEAKMPIGAALKILKEVKKEGGNNVQTASFV